MTSLNPADLENHMVLPEAAPNEPPEPDAGEIEDAEREVLADMLQVKGACSVCHTDGRTLVDESWRESDLAASFLHDLTVELHSGYTGMNQHDDAEIGRMVRLHVEDYLRNQTDFERRVDEQIARNRQERAEQARADEGFEA